MQNVNLEGILKTSNEPWGPQPRPHQLWPRPGLLSWRMMGIRCPCRIKKLRWIQEAKEWRDAGLEEEVIDETGLVRECIHEASRPPVWSWLIFKFFLLIQWNKPTNLQTKTPVNKSNLYQLKWHMVSKSWILQRDAQSKTTITIIILLLQTQASNCNHLFGLKCFVQH